MQILARPQPHTNWSERVALGLLTAPQIQQNKTILKTELNNIPETADEVSRAYLCHA